MTLGPLYCTKLATVRSAMLAGELSPAVAWVLILGLAVAGTAIAAVNFGPLISSLYAFGLFLGTVYSIPPFRCDALTGFRVQTTVIPAGLQATGRQVHVLHKCLATLTALPCGALRRRLKRFAIPAFMIIATVRGFLLNFGVFYATRAALGLTFTWSPAIM